jgi:hypothetical protein
MDRLLAGGHHPFCSLGFDKIQTKKIGRQELKHILPPKS